MTDFITCHSVQLHTGVVMGQSLRLVRRLEDWSQSWRRDVGNLQGQRGLVQTESTTYSKSVLVKTKESKTQRLSARR